MPTQPGILVRGAGFCIAATGFVAFMAGAQIAAFFILTDPLARAVPELEMLLGGALVVTGTALAIPKGWARLPAVLLPVALGAISVPWVLWLAWQTVFSPLALMVPVGAAGSFVSALVAWREAGRVARAIAEVDKENARLLAEALRNPDPLWDPPKPTNGWFLPLVGGVLAVPVAGFLLVVIAPTLADWAETRVQGILAGRMPFASAWVETPTSYPFAGSPFAWYLDYESKWIDLPRDTILATADAIADETAWKLAAATGTADPVEGERRLWADGREQLLPLWIAESLRARGAYYSPESLLSRSFDPNVHLTPDTIHLDCDLLVYLYMHVGWRLDLAMEPVPSPLHVYLRYSAPDGSRSLYVETTQFRHIDIAGNRVNFLGAGIGEDYFIAEDYYSSGKGGTWAAPDVVEAAGLYQPWKERDIRDAIVANVLVGVKHTGKDVPFIPEAEARADGSREITLVSNLFEDYIDAGRAALADGKLDEAEAYATKAADLRRTHGAVVIFGDPLEETLRGEVEAARAVTATAN
jgi:hypothetical protein